MRKRLMVALVAVNVLMGGIHLGIGPAQAQTVDKLLKDCCKSSVEGTKFCCDNCCWWGGYECNWSTDCGKFIPV